MVKPEIVQKALKAIKRATDYEYFFDQLSSTDWIEPLWEAGLFRSPYEPIREGEYIRFPQWPESRYLARMAPHAPEIVLKVCLEIPETENIRVHEDLVDAAVKMPPHLSAEFVPKAKVWIETPYPSLLPEKLGELVAHLSRGGQSVAALDLAQALLMVLSDSRAVEKTAEDKTYRLSPEPGARFDLWDYEQIIKKNIPDLVAAAPQETFELLCNLLDSAIRLSRRRDEDEGPVDYSYIWRPDIDSLEHIHGLKDLLVTAVRDAAEKIIHVDAMQLPRLVSMLEKKDDRSYKWHVFQRIALHLVRRFPEAAPTLVVERLLDPKLLDAGWCQNEYRQLLQDRFAHLSATEQKRWLDFIEQGPPADARKDVEPKSPEEKEQRATHWRRELLAVVADQLPPEWRDRHRQWTDGLIVPKDFAASRVVTWYGPTSPKSPQDLKAMTVSELLSFLQTWQQPDDPWTSSLEGLGRQLTTVVSEEPARFAQEALHFQVLDPTYVRAVISGLEEACKAEKPFDWVPVLQLCHWVVTQPREIPGRRLQKGDADPDWGWTRKAIARLLSAGIDKGATEISFTHKQEVWGVIKSLTDDPDPTQEYEAQYSGSKIDPAALSINTVRGDAMHTVVRYALWVRRNLEKLPDASERLAHGFNEMSEVLEVFNAHLDVSRDQSLAVRAVYGQWFPWLSLLDSGWASENVSRIFPHDPALRPFLDAAWETYVMFCKPYDQVFQILREEYEGAVDRIGQPSGGRHAADPEECLAEHLIVFYLRGKINMADSGNVLALFYEKSTVKLRAHVIEFMGRSLYTEGTTVRPELVERSKIFWQRRLDDVKTVRASSQSDELIQFGWWFASGKFDDTWSISQIMEVLRLTGKVKPDHLVVKRLASLAVRMPLEVVQCLRKMIEGDREDWKIRAWQSEARTILSTAIQARNVDAREAAIDLVHRLGARGYLEFRDLLPI